jgi:acetate---CoA ligase (ADP-forming)
MQAVEAPPIPIKTLGEGSGRLIDGTPVLVHQICLKDHPRLCEFVKNLSEETLELRFFGPVRPEMATAELEECECPPDRLSLAAELATDPRKFIGQAEYVRDGPKSTSAEVAFVVAERFRGRGVATLLLHHLAEAARAVGIERFHATVQGPNSAMLEVFRGAGFRESEGWAEGDILVSFPIGTSPASDSSAPTVEGRMHSKS